MNKWIAVDWGTSSFRAYLIENEIVSDRIETQDGMKFISQNDFEIVFIKLICFLYNLIPLFTFNLLALFLIYVDVSS